MANSKVQKVWCCQCEAPISPRCAKCLKDPSRKPRIVEIYDAPPILATNECGCVKIRCQREGCIKTKWLHPRADGTLGFKNHFCSPQCVRLVTAAGRKAKRVSKPCDCGCGIMLSLVASKMRSKYNYFSQKHNYAHRVWLKAKARREKDNGSIQAKVCESKYCRGAVTDHKRVDSGLYACVRCGIRSKEANLNATSDVFGLSVALPGK